MKALVPILTILAAIILAWYLAVIPMNIKEALTQAERGGAVISTEGAQARRDMSAIGLVASNPFAIPATFAQDRPRLPAPHQVAAEMWDTIVMKNPSSKRSLIYHGWVTLSTTLLGFGIGSVLGIILAIGITHSRVMSLSVMPWAIVSQTIPIIALAPMVIVVLYSIGVQGILPKAIISAYLSFFPVVVGMVKGLRSPDAMQFDLLRTYSASAGQGFWKLRLPASMPYLFTSLKIAISAALVGAIVGELPTGAKAGFGARLLSGSYYGQNIQIWSALFAAAILAALLIVILNIIEKATLKRMGMA